MKFLAIKPREEVAEVIEAKDAHAAYRMVGLDPLKIDHGVALKHDGGGLGIVVYEFGLFEPSQEQSYFAIGQRLYAGNALIYNFDHKGATVDFELGRPPVPIWWFDNAADVEAAITNDTISRPQMLVNGDVIWEWPQPAPPGMKR